jgi:hypothetical protein
VIWGSGTPMREFLHVDDMAAASVHVMDLPREAYRGAHAAHAQPHQRRHRRGLHDPRAGRDHRARHRLPGRLVWDASKPDGTPRKLMDVSRLAALGWRPPPTSRRCSIVMPTRNQAPFMAASVDSVLRRQGIPGAGAGRADGASDRWHASSCWPSWLRAMDGLRWAERTDRRARGRGQQARWRGRAPR